MNARATPLKILPVHAILGGLAIVYLLQIYSPLRLNTDAVHYLVRAVAFVEGWNAPHPEWLLPMGYSYLVGLLDLIGLGTSWAFVALNCLFLGAGLTAGYKLLRQDFLLSHQGALLICCLTLLSFIVVKHATLPMAEISFFGITLVALWLTFRARREPAPAAWYLYAAACILLIASIAFRTIGIALIPVLVWSMWSAIQQSDSSREAGRRRLRSTIMAVVVLVLLAAAGFVFLSQTSYMDQLYYIYRDHGLVNNVKYTLSGRLREWGELFLNVPASRIPGNMRWLLRLTGVAAAAFGLAGVFIRRDRWSECEVFLLAYGLILFVYTGHSSRYWLPILPLLMAWVACSFGAIYQYEWARRAIAVYVTVFALAGAAALAYTSGITFAGRDFPERYGDGTLTHTYEAAFEGRAAPHLDNDEINDLALELLYRYDPRFDPADDRASSGSPREETTIP